MKKTSFTVHLFITVFLANISFLTQAQYLNPDEETQGFPKACTSIMVGRLASTDGSVITSQTCDGGIRTSLEIFPHSKFTKGTMHSVYSGVILPGASLDMKNVTRKGEIPEVEETYAFLNTAYPCLNEKQLAIGETTIGGKVELRNKDGLFLIEELQKIALQRCKTAREAIVLIGKLAEEFGFGDYGECLTIADPKEVWHLEITGSGKGKPSAIWCAARIPDDHVGVSANLPRISTIDFNNSDLFMYSTDLQGVAKRLGYWDGKEPMKFWKVISSKNKAFALREFYILSTLAPSLKLSEDSEELPFSVKPENKLSARDIMKYFRETYEGTQWDMTKDLLITVSKKVDDRGNSVEEKIKSPIAHNWMNDATQQLLNELKPGIITKRRHIALDMCSHSFIIQCRSWLPDEVGAIAWFSFDNPGLSPRIPIFSGVTRLPLSFSICGQPKYRTDAALWSFREANRLATINWGRDRTLIESAVKELEDKAFEEIKNIEEKVVELIKAGKNSEARKYVTSYTNDFAYSAMKRWEEMKVILWTRIGTEFN